MAGRRLLLQAVGWISPGFDPGGDLGALPLDVAQSQAPQAAGLIALFVDAGLLYASNDEVRLRAADLERLRWLAQDHDEMLLVHAVELSESSVAGHQAQLPPPPLSLLQLAERSWLSGARQLGLMALLAYSLNKPVPGKLVYEALQRLLSPEVPAPHIAHVASLAPCMRSALVALLARRGHDGVSTEVARGLAHAVSPTHLSWALTTAALAGNGCCTFIPPFVSSAIHRSPHATAAERVAIHLEGGCVAHARRRPARRPASYLRAAL